MVTKSNNHAIEIVKGNGDRAWVYCYCGGSLHA